MVGLTGVTSAKCTRYLAVCDAFPDRFFNVGMAEQNLIAIAAGMARTGLLPFARPIVCSRRGRAMTSSRLLALTPASTSRSLPVCPIDDGLWRNTPGN